MTAVLDPTMLRTANELRSGDVAELFPGSPVVVLYSHRDEDLPGHRRIVVLTADRDVSIQVVPDGTWYAIRSRGALGRAVDRLLAARIADARATSHDVDRIATMLEESR